jgi:hypothetical protein
MIKRENSTTELPKHLENSRTRLNESEFTRHLQLQELNLTDLLTHHFVILDNSNGGNDRHNHNDTFNNKEYFYMVHEID